MNNANVTLTPGTELLPGNILIGDNGGRSEIYDLEPSNSIFGLLAVETEHGFLYLDPDGEYPVAKEG